MHIISAADFPLFCSNSARKCLILPSECPPQKWLILLEILPEEPKPGRWWSRCESDGPPFLMALVAVARKLKWGACSYAMQISLANDSMQHTIENNVISLKTMG